jgi:hypothetical protein
MKVYDSLRLIPPASGDIAFPADGDIWYNSTTGRFRKMQDGDVTDLDDRQVTGDRLLGKVGSSGTVEEIRLDASLEFDGYYLKVASSFSNLVVANRVTADYSLVLGDANKIVELNSASAIGLTVPRYSSVAFPTGTQILVSQYGAGQGSIIAGSGVTIRSAGAKLKLNSQYSGATLVKIGTDEWYLFGDLKT